MADLLVVEEGFVDIYVLGTDSIEVAAKALPDEVGGWLTARTGNWVRRKNGMPRVPAGHSTKDMLPGVQFSNIVRS